MYYNAYRLVENGQQNKANRMEYISSSTKLNEASMTYNSKISEEVFCK